MKLFSLLFIENAISQECKPSYAAQERCWDDCDLEWRQCLANFQCDREDFAPSQQCTDDRKNYCWFTFQACKYGCPCGDKPVKGKESAQIDTRATCLNGCPCPDSANKKDFCIEDEHEILTLQTGKIRSLNYRHDMKPDQSYDFYNFKSFETYPANWPDFNLSDACSFSLFGRMYVIGGANTNNEGYNNFEIVQDGANSYSWGLENRTE